MKARIKEVEMVRLIDKERGGYTVKIQTTYESGAVRMYLPHLLPKTVQDFLGGKDQWVMAVDKMRKHLEESILEGMAPLERVAAQIKGKGQGAGRDFESFLKGSRKSTVIYLAIVAGMEMTDSRTTKKAALAYLLAA